MLIVKLICFFARIGDMRLSLSAMVFTVPINSFCNSGSNSRLLVSFLRNVLYHKKINNSNKNIKNRKINQIDFKLIYFE